MSTNKQGLVVQTSGSQRLEIWFETQVEIRLYKTQPFYLGVTNTHYPSREMVCCASCADERDWLDVTQGCFYTGTACELCERENEAGFYYALGNAGCLFDSEPCGPFDSLEEAYRAAEQLYSSDWLDDDDAAPFLPSWEDLQKESV